MIKNINQLSSPVNEQAHFFNTGSDPRPDSRSAPQTGPHVELSAEPGSDPSTEPSSDLSSDLSSARVQDFYERYPYPPPLNNLEAYRPQWQDVAHRRAQHFLHWPWRSFNEQPVILVAGCGTSQAAKHALRWPEARVVGIDFSATSVRHTQMLKQKYQLDNLEVYQLPIERVSELGVTFEQIICTGVLHHLPQPELGLKALRQVLAENGALQLMVYAPYGRAGIYLLQDFCRRLGIQANDESIKNLIATLRHLPAGHPLHTLLREAPDFRNPAALADALLHPQDRAYSVEQLLALLADADLTLGRWLRQAPYRPGCGALSQTPEYSRLAGLTPAAQYAAAEVFRGTMVRHSVIAYPNGGEGSRYAVNFAGDGWQHYVPLRWPTTVVVEENLPPGAVAVLINRDHSDRDLYLPIDKANKRLFDRIDGKRTLAEIGRGAGNLKAARIFFEQLWWYDQILLDTSRLNSPAD